MTRGNNIHDISSQSALARFKILHDVNQKTTTYRTVEADANFEKITGITNTGNDENLYPEIDQWLMEEGNR